MQPCNSTSGYLHKNPNLKRFMYPYVHCTTIYNIYGMQAT